MQSDPTLGSSAELGEEDGPLVLIVDSDRTIRGFLPQRLVERGVRVAESSRVSQVVRLVDQATPDAIFVEYADPPPGGAALIGHLRSTQPEIPVIALYRDDDDAAEQLARGQGVADFVYKPFRFDALWTTLRQALGEDVEAGCAIEEAAQAAEEELPAQAGAREAALPKDASLLQRVRARLGDGNICLPVAPPVVVRLRSIIGNPTHGIHHVREVVEQDQELTLQVLNAARAVASAGRVRTKGLHDAIGRIGDRRVLSIAARCVTRRMRAKIADEGLRKAAEHLHQRTLEAALAARVLAWHVPECDSEDAYLAALLADIGEPFLLRVISDMIPSTPAAARTPVRVLAILRAHHAEFGAAILAGWGAMAELAVVAKHHPGPPPTGDGAQLDADTTRLLHLLSLARASVAEVAGWPEGVSRPFAPPDESAELLHLTDAGRERFVSSLSDKLEAAARGQAKAAA